MRLEAIIDIATDGSVGTKDVIVTNPNGKSYTLGSGLTVLPPRIWSIRDPLLSIPKITKPVKGGGSVASLGDRVYCTPGNNTLTFERYTISGNSWGLGPSVPLGPKNKKVKTGAYLVADDCTYVYLFKGGGTNEFYRYNADAEIWDSLSGPGFTKGIKGGFAATVHLDSTTGYIYAGSGSNTNEWKRFNLSTNSWEPAVPATLPAVKVNIGSALTYDGNGKLYFLLGGGKENDFYVTDITSPTPTWTTLPDLPLSPPGISRKKKVREGGCIEFFNAKVYAVKGGSTREFWAYTPETSTWEYIGEVGTYPRMKGIKCGRSLTASSNGIFCLFGNNTNEFWFYGTPPPSITPATSPILSEVETPSVFKLEQNYPNPFNPTTVLSFELGALSRVTLRVYNLLGQEVATLLDREEMDEGEQEVEFTAENLASGVYFYRIAAQLISEDEDGVPEQFISVKKMLFLK